MSIVAEKLVSDQLTALRAAGDPDSLRTASELEGEFEDHKLEVLRESDNPLDRAEVAKLEAAAEVREVVADQGVDAAQVRPSGQNKDGGLQLTADDVREHAERGGPPQGLAAQLSPEQQRIAELEAEVQQLRDDTGPAPGPTASGGADPGNGTPPVDFASDEAAEAANKAGLGPEQLLPSQGSGKDGAFTVADVREVEKAMEGGRD